MKREHIQKKTIWGENYIGGQLHKEGTIQGVDYKKKGLHRKTEK